MPRKTFATRRVAFQPPDEETTAQYLLLWPSADLYHRSEQYPRLTSTQLFQNDSPLELEVGCGTGEFLNYLAANEPGTNFLGVDVSLKSLYAATHQAKDGSLANIRFVKAGVQQLYPLFVPDSLSAVYFHYPDPYLHPKYRKRRIFTQTFLDVMHEALVPGGHISVMTDNPQLFDIMLKLVETDTRFEKVHEERFLVGSGWEHEFQVPDRLGKAGQGTAQVPCTKTTSRFVINV